MATLVLTAVGTAAGGPIGGAIGALLGQQIDAAIFAPKARKGPRLGELAVQTSSYGTAIPKIFGRMRVAGSVIWATDLKEERTRSGGGKGRPSTETYSYSASFAVAVSARTIRGIGRIWADGKLLRGAAGDFKTETRFRLYKGTEAQRPDPLIASVEGIGGAPAHRGIAYAMFEDFQLAEYGNRIPSLTFEVEADAEPVAIGAIAAELSEGEIAAGGTPRLAGYAASGDSIRGAIEVLGDFAALPLRDEAGRLRLGGSPGEPVSVRATDTEARGLGEAGGRSEFARLAASALPAEVAVAYHDVDRDFQTGLQRATRGGSPVRAVRIGLPVALCAAEAKAAAEQRLARAWAARETGKVYLGWKLGLLKPGTELRLDGHGGVWRVVRWTLHGMVACLELVRARAGPLPTGGGASPGRTVGEQDRPHGPTTLFVAELPLLGSELSDRPRLYAAAAGEQIGWRRAALIASFDGGGSWQPQPSLATPATAGRLLTPLPAAGSALLDLRNSLDVELLNDAMWLESRSDDALVAGANLAVVGEEMIQFGIAKPLGNRRFRLSRLLRGRRGTEWAAQEHMAGVPFLLIEREKLTQVEVPSGLQGAEARLVARGVGDPSEGVEVRRTISALGMVPPAPVHFTSKREAGDIVFRWVRRSRIGWNWLSGIDTPLGEEQELYRLLITGSGFKRVIDATSPAALYSQAQQVEDGAWGPLRAEVRQIGTHGLSRAAVISAI